MATRVIPYLAHAWQAFDVVRHPRHGQVIVVSTTKTARCRELKVQFVDGALVLESTRWLLQAR